MIANGLNGSAPLNRVREFQRFSHNDSLKARMILISQGGDLVCDGRYQFYLSLRFDTQRNNLRRIWRRNQSYDSKPIKKAGRALPA